MSPSVETSLLPGTTVVGDYINTMKTTFEFNFDLNYAVNQHGYAKTSNSREFIN